MSIIVSSACVCVLLAAPVETGTLLTYRGQLVPERAEGKEARKEISYQVLAAGPGEKGTRLVWLISEKGQGGWSWIEHFGEIEIDDRGRIVAGSPASVLFEHDEGLSVVPLVPPVFDAPKPLEPGLAWRDDRLQFEVLKPEGVPDEKLWNIEVRTAIGHKRTLSVRKDLPVIAELDETVFMGPGKRHTLTLVAEKETKLDAAALERSLKVLAALTALRADLKHEPQRPKVSWNEDQLALLKERVPEIMKQAADTPLAAHLLRAAGDAKLQDGIAEAVKKLRAEFIGEPAPALDLPPATLSGTPLKSGDLKGKVLVLHLWTYRDQPLVEPYGQIGYLDFLHRKRKDAGVAVFGVAVDERLDRPNTRSEAIRSIRKLQSFMNVGYPVALGGRDVLESFGDPAKLGAELPLFVVIDREGKIAHYHPGMYAVDRDRGLVELDTVVEEMLKK